MSRRTAGRTLVPVHESGRRTGGLPYHRSTAAGAPFGRDEAVTSRHFHYGRETT